MSYRTASLILFVHHSGQNILSYVPEDFNSEVYFYPNAALRRNLRLKSCPRTALCTRSMHNMNRIWGCNGTPDFCLDICRPDTRIWITRSEWKSPQHLGSPRVDSGTKKRQCPKACSPGKGRCAASIKAILGTAFLCSHNTNSWAEFFIMS